MKKIIALMCMLAIAFSLVGCFNQATIKASIENVEIEVYDFDRGLSEIVVTNDIIEEYSSISASARVIWKDTTGNCTVSWEFVGDDLGCKLYVIDPSCTGGRLASVHFGDNRGKVVLRVTASSKNQVSADLTIWIGQKNEQPNIDES